DGEPIVEKSKVTKHNPESEVVNMSKLQEKELKELRERMIANGYQELLDVLENTDKSYRDIERELDIKYPTIAYYGMRIRTPEHRNRIKRQVSKNVLNKSIENNVTYEKEDVTTIDIKPTKLTTNVIIKTIGNDISMDEVKSTLNEMVAKIDSYNNVKSIKL